MRTRLLTEEFEEYLSGDKREDIVNVAVELADIIYVAYGTAISYGIPLDRVLAEVHSANMAKLDENGEPIRREDGKVLKSEGWQPADIEAILIDAGWSGEDG